MRDDSPRCAKSELRAKIYERGGAPRGPRTPDLLVRRGKSSYAATGSILQEPTKSTKSGKRFRLVVENSSRTMTLTIFLRPLLCLVRLGYQNSSCLLLALFLGNLNRLFRLLWFWNRLLIHLRSWFCARDGCGYGRGGFVVKHRWFPFRRLAVRCLRIPVSVVVR